MKIIGKDVYLELNPLEFTKWVGTITSVIGAFIVAVGALKLGYILFTVGSGAWFIVGFWTKDKAMITLNAFFLAADFVGLWRAIF